MKKIDGKEYNTAKRVSIATEFDKFKDVLLNEKIIRHNMKRIQSKKRKLGTCKIEKIYLSLILHAPKTPKAPKAKANKQTKIKSLFKNI